MIAVYQYVENMQHGIHPYVKRHGNFEYNPKDYINNSFTNLMLDIKNKHGISSCHSFVLLNIIDL